MDSVIKFTTNTTAWRVIASDGVGYADIATLQAAGKKCYPNLDPGKELSNLTIYTEDGSGGDGDTLYFAINRNTDFSGLVSDAARDAVATLVSGGGQKFTREGVNMKNRIPVVNVWVRKTTGTDYAVLSGDY